MEIKNKTKQCLYCARYYIDREQEVGLFGICPECKATTKSGSHEPEAVLSEQTCSYAIKALQVIY